MEFVCTNPQCNFEVDLKSKPVVAGNNYIICQDASVLPQNGMVRIYDSEVNKQAFFDYHTRISMLMGKYGTQEFFKKHTLENAPQFLSELGSIATQKGQRSFCAVKFMLPDRAVHFAQAYNSDMNISPSLLSNLFMGLMSAFLELRTQASEICGLDLDNIWAMGTNPIFVDFVVDEKSDSTNKLMIADFESKDKRQSIFNFFTAVYCYFDTGYTCKNLSELRKVRNGLYGRILDETTEKIHSHRHSGSGDSLSLDHFGAVLFRYISKERNHLPKVINYIQPKISTPQSYLMHRDILEKAYEIKDYNYNELELKPDYFSLRLNPNRKVRVNISGQFGDPEYDFDALTRQVVVTGGDEICYGFKDKANNKPHIFSFQSQAAATFINTFNGRGILADQVGMGKTIEAGLIVSEYAARAEKENRWHTLLIVSKTGENDDGEGKLIKQWRDEMAEKFGLFIKPLERKNRSAASSEYLLDRVAPLFEGGVRRRTKPIEGVHDGGELCYPACIISYQDFIKQDKFFRENPDLQPPQIDMLIVDEAHQLITAKLLEAVERCVKNPKVVLTDEQMFGKSIAMNLVRKLISKYCILLTATPHKGDLTMLYPYMKLLKQNERGYTNIAEFFRDVCKGCKTVKEFKQRYGTGALEEIRAMMRVVAIRNTRNNTQLQLEWKKKFSHVYFFNNLSNQMDKLAFDDLFVDTGNGVKYKKSFNDHSEIDVVEYSGKQADLEMAKLETMQKIARRHSREKMIVFFDAPTVAEENARRKKIKKQLEEMLNNRRVYDDATEFENEERLYGSNNGILLADAKSSEGRNLQFAHVLVNFDIMKCPMKMEQRIGRIDRIGQLRDMMIYSFASLGSLDGQLLAVYDNVLKIFSQWNGDIMYVAGSIFGGKDGEDSDKGSIFEKRVTDSWKKMVKGVEDYPKWSAFWNQKSQQLAYELDETRDDVLEELKSNDENSETGLNKAVDKDGGVVVVQKQSDYKQTDLFLARTARRMFEID